MLILASAADALNRNTLLLTIELAESYFKVLLSINPYAIDLSHKATLFKNRSSGLSINAPVFQPRQVFRMNIFPRFTI